MSDAGRQALERDPRARGAHLNLAALAVRDGRCAGRALAWCQGFNAWEVTVLYSNRGGYRGRWNGTQKRLAQCATLRSPLPSS